MNEAVAEAVEGFDAAWRRDPFPDLEDFVPRAIDPRTRASCLALLISVDLEYRWRTNLTDWSSRSMGTDRTASGPAQPDLPHRPLLEDYLARTPELEDDPSILVELVAAEYQVRVRWGDLPCHDEYFRRFRSHSGRIRDALYDADAAISADRSTSSRPQSGERVFGEYVITGELGRGGMGVVYEARHKAHGNRVALKTIRSLDMDLSLRLKQEFRSLAELSHPNLVKFDTLNAEGEQPFVTMEFVDGVPFVKHVRGHFDSAAAGDQHPQVDLNRLVDSLRQLVAAIQYLHNADKLHRDIKPSNVLVTADGRVVVLDFGLVVELRENEYANSQQLPAGTLAYMSPEQQQGHLLTPASDWYSVGVMLYESITGVRPFEATSFHDYLSTGTTAECFRRYFGAQTPWL